ncbi:MAG: cyclopropane-fatty-acyl-phospholipid synthase [Firmicutes bacterium]|nr:cyclopropane-fatty-acyl-phospholipid synthase [Bacillota bacterium]
MVKLYDSVLRESILIPAEMRYWDGSTSRNSKEEPRVVITFKKPIDLGKARKDFSLTLAEAYMDGDIEIDGSIQELMCSLFANDESFMESKKFKMLKFLQGHGKNATKEDIAFHYDIGNDFYRYWLDESMTYSCAYFLSEDDSLEQAQEQKIDHILKKLRLKEGETLLDIGCGWGNLIIRAAETYPIKAYGCTLSEEQKTLADQRIKEKGLEDRVQVFLTDYRDLVAEGRHYDKIVSVGMFEHVGKEDIPEYFKNIDDLMADRGLALIHGISGQRDPDDPDMGRNSFLNKYIFPGGYIPAIAEIVTPIDKLRLHLIDMESLRRHYQLTLEAWAERFHAHWDVLEEMMGEKFMRMWDIYLNACAAIFEAGKLDVCQYLIEKGTDNERPLSRSYML